MLHKTRPTIYPTKGKFILRLKGVKDKFPIAFQLQDHQLMQKATILFFFSIILALLLTPHIQFTYPTYSIGSIAGSNIKADRDFLVEKKAATEQRKMEAFNEIPSVYDYDGDVLIRIQSTIANAYQLLKEVGQSTIEVPISEEKISPRQIKKNLESTLGITLSDEEFKLLYQSSSSSLMMQNISKLISAAYHNALITNVTFVQSEIEKGIIVRDVNTQNDTEIRDLSKIHTITDVALSLRKNAITIIGMTRPDLGKAALAVTIKLLQPNLIYNRNATALKKEEAVNDVKPVFLKVLRNEMLVREGEKITPVIMDKLDSYYRIKGDKQLSKFLIFAGTFCVIVLLSLVLYLPVQQWHKAYNLDLVLLGVVALLQISLIKAGIFVAEAATDAFPLLHEEVFIYAIPFSMAAMLVSLLVNRHLSLILSIFLSVTVTLLFDGKISLFLYSFLGNVVALHLIVNCRKRTAFLKIGLMLGLVNAIAILCLGLLSENPFTINTFFSIIMGFLGGFMSSVLVSGLSPIFESLFHYMTDIKLLELANLNQPIFQEMVMETPGTYNHSVVLASMVEAAAESIGANSLLAKVSAYYHDIGKMKKPQYFIENQQNGDNKHDKISPKMSSLVIISHVKEGCDLANRVKLGKEINDIIREHHGTSLVSFFYEKAKKDKDPSIRSLTETDFRYPGPKPQSKEAGLILLGDVVEASSRNLSNPTPSRIKTLVRERFDRVLSDGQLDECPLTLSDLDKIAESFTMILYGIFHHRIHYPEPAIHAIHESKKGTENGTIDKKPTEKNKDRNKAA